LKLHNFVFVLFLLGPITIIYSTYIGSGTLLAISMGYSGMMMAFHNYFLITENLQTSDKTGEET